MDSDEKRMALIALTAMTTHGKGWEHLSDRQQRGEMALAALLSLYQQDETISGDRLRHLVNLYAEFIAAFHNEKENSNA